MPLFSVIIPTYNRAYLLGRAIQSVLSQEGPEFELIIVDDGSEDRTERVVSSFNDRRIVYIRQNNRGVAAARNRGVRESKGELLAFLDSDDYWLPGKLEAQARFFDENPASRIVQTDEIWIRNGRRVNPGKKHKKIGGWIFSKSLRMCVVSPSAVAMKRDLFEETGGFDESMPVCEDYDLWLRISVKYQIHLIERHYIVKTGGHPDQLSRTPCLDRWRIKSILKILESGELNADMAEEAVQELRRKCEIYANGCLKRGRKEEGERYMALARRYACSLL